MSGNGKATGLWAPPAVPKMPTRRVLWDAQASRHQGRALSQLRFAADRHTLTRRAAWLAAAAAAGALLIWWFFPAGPEEEEYDPYALPSGFLGMITGATQMVVGEAGPERVAVLRNPRTVPGMGSSGTVGDQ